VQDSRLLVAVEAQDGTRERGRGPVVHRASAVRAEWLLDLYIERVRESDELVWNADAERVERVERLWYEQLVLDESRDLAGARARAEDAAAILARAALVAGVDRFYPAEELARWRGRLAFAARIAPDAGLPGLDDATLAAGLTALCAGRTSFAELRATALEQLIGQLLTPAQRAQLERLAPLTVPLGKRPRVAVHYELDREPWIASRLQDFFGMARGPAVAAGRVPLVLHLLAPNQRAVQITQDLAGFWERHYPALRKQLMRRYPRHAWPEDPLHA
jgi:ATP-dependent helicase HrpB